MSESDYQRGLRGGPAKVSIGDWERYSDWKAGHDEYEREQEERDTENLMQVLTPAEKLEWFNERMKARQLKEERSYQYEQEREIKKEKQKEIDKRKDQEIITSIVVCGLFAIIGFINGCSAYINGMDGPGYIGDKGKYFLYPFIYPIINAFVGWILVKIVFVLIKISK